MSAPPSSKCTIRNASSRLDLFTSLQEDPSHPLNTCWPEFLSHDQSQIQFADTVLSYPGLRKFQFAVTELDEKKREIIVAVGRSIPFYWPELESISKSQIAKWLSEGDEVCEEFLKTLPDGGWDTIVARGVRQHCFNNITSEWEQHTEVMLTEDQRRDERICLEPNQPNALSALSITVREDRRGMGLAEALVEELRKAAKEEGFKVLVAPLRPTRKASFPSLSMETYISWIEDLHLSQRSKRRMENITVTKQLPFDSWLRKHIRLGGKVVKIASESMRVEGSIDDWQRWTGIDIPRILEEVGENEVKVDTDEQVYVEVKIEGGLVPLKVYVGDGTCTYVEPNVWVCHEVK